jgi:hypothetical protein
VNNFVLRTGFKTLILQARIAEKEYALNLSPLAQDQVRGAVDQLIRHFDDLSQKKIALRSRCAMRPATI